MRHSVGFLTTLAIGIVGLAFLTGCTRSRSIDRAKVLEAENMNLRQKARTMSQQMQQAHAAQDDAVAREQQLRAELAMAQQDSRAAAAAQAQAAAARERIASLQDDLGRVEDALSSSNQRYEKLLADQVRQPAPQPVARSGGPIPVRPGGTSPEVEAMRRDLQRQLASYGVRGLDVEVRRDRGGDERVAIVLPDAFPPGKATLAYNADAVKAVISVGKMITAHYPESHVTVEGHTDSDPIRKSQWGTNERLSEARAAAVETLLTNSGVQNVSTHGLGASQPLAMGSTKRAKSRNRRVEIFISPRG